MTTTAIFVEYLILGVQAAAWVGLFAAVSLGTVITGPAQAFAAHSPSIATVVFLAAAYTLGLVVDLIAHVVFLVLRPQRMLLRLRIGRRWATQADDGRVLVLVKEGKAESLLEYIRRRVRVLRGTAINSLLLVVALLSSRWSGPLASVSTSVFLLAVGVAMFATVACFAAATLVEAGYERRVRMIRSALQGES
jgi:hypothetical protein